MKSLTTAIFLLFVLLNTTQARADGHSEWFKYLTGEWTYQRKADEGEFSETGTIRWRRAARGNALVGRITTGTNDQEIEVAGWQADKKMILVTGFSSNGGSWHIPYTEITDDQLSSKSASGVLPDGRPWKSDSFVLKKKNNTQFEMRSEGIELGDRAATEELLPVVYQELRKLAAAKLAHEKPGQTLQATALVHEAYMRLVDQTNQPQWDNSRHLFSAAAEAMRRILVERARQRASLKRGGDRERIELDGVDPAVMPLACDDILGLDEALQTLQQNDARKAQLVKLRFFAGLTVAQAAQTLGLSTSTAENDWSYARSWLRLEMSEDVKD